MIEGKEFCQRTGDEGQAWVFVDIVLRVGFRERNRIKPRPNLHCHLLSGHKLNAAWNSFCCGLNADWSKGSQNLNLLFAAPLHCIDPFLRDSA